jgi:hypothetical protein
MHYAGKQPSLSRANARRSSLPQPPTFELVTAVLDSFSLCLGERLGLKFAKPEAMMDGFASREPRGRRGGEGDTERARPAALDVRV